MVPQPPTGGVFTIADDNPITRPLDKVAPLDTTHMAPWMAAIEDALLPSQRVVRKFIVEHPYCGVFLGMGGGKTLTTLSALSLVQPPGNTLVIAPINIARDTWTDEIEKWGIPLPVVSLVQRPHKNNPDKFTPLSRKERLERYELAYDTDNPKVFIIGKENIDDLVEFFATKGFTRKTPKYDQWPFSTVIIDESQSFKKAGNVGSKALRRVRPYINRLIAMTGTPSPEELGDLFGQMLIIDGGERLGKYESRFRDTFFNPIAMKDNIVTKWEPKAGANEEVYRRIADVTMSVHNSALDTLPPCAIDTVELNLTPELRKTYREFMRTFIMDVADTQLPDNARATDKYGNALYLPDSKLDFTPDSLQAQLDAISQSGLNEKQKWRETAALPSGIGNLTNAAVQTITATNAGALRMKLLQFASGAIYLDVDPDDDEPIPTGTTRPYHVVHSLKLDALRTIITERDPVAEPVIVAYRFISDVERIQADLREHGFDPIVFDGASSTKRAWNKGEIPIMLLQPASAAHGLNLQDGGHRLIWFALPDSSEKYQQTNARLHRLGQKHPVDIAQLTVKGTVDARLPGILQQKRDQENALLDAVRHDVAQYSV